MNSVGVHKAHTLQREQNSLKRYRSFVESFESELINEIDDKYNKEGIIMPHLSHLEESIPKTIIKLPSTPYCYTKDMAMDSLISRQETRVDPITVSRFGLEIALLEQKSPLDALGAKIALIGKEHLDRVDAEIATTQAE